MSYETLFMLRMQPSVRSIDMRSGQSERPGVMVALLMLVLGLMVTGCVPHYTDYEAFMKQPRPIVGGKPYVLEPPDSVTISEPAAWSQIFST